MFNTLKSLVKPLVFVGVALSSVAFAQAQDVTLRSEDGRVNLSGPLLDVTDDYFVLQTQFGPVRVASANVECIGDACPGNEAVASDEVVWDVSLWGKKRAFTNHVEKLSELLAARTDGKFRLNLSYGGLSDARDNLDGISQGSFEMAQFCAGYHREKNPTLTVLELPFLGVTSLEQEVALSKAVYAHPATQADLARWNATLLMPSPLPQYNIIGAGAVPLSLTDFGNMRVRATGGVGKAIEALGADLAAMPATEVQAALEAGEVDAVSFAPHAHMAFGTIDRAAWWTTNLNPGTVHCPVVVNSDALEELPQVFRIALASSIDEALDFYVESYNSTTMDSWWPALQERGIMELTFNEDILSSIRDAVATPAAQEWISENAARGLPAQELYDLVTGLIKEGAGQSGS